MIQPVIHYCFLAWFRMALDECEDHGEDNELCVAKTVAMMMLVWYLYLAWAWWEMGRVCRTDSFFGVPYNLMEHGVS